MSMPPTLGIQRETKSEWERRAPLTPDHVRSLIGQGVQVVVQPSAVRVFPDAAYAEAGATVQDDLSGCDAIVAVKEIPVEHLLPGKTYGFFSHTVKGQAHNMPLLRQLLDLGCRLVDYERIVDDTGRRLIFFGRHAGYAGMLDTLHLLGARLLLEGHATALAKVRLAHRYASLAEAAQDLQILGERISREGFPAALGPVVIGIAGYGNVSQGAQAILSHLPVDHLTPEDLLTRDPASLRRDRLYQVVFREEDLVRAKDAEAGFGLADYYQRPERYTGRFADYLDRLTVVVNALYWEPAYPRLITREDLARLWSQSRSPRLRVIGDLGCDIGGTVEVTVKATSQDEPAFVYEPATGAVRDGIQGDGPIILAVDNLPCELAVEASMSFGEALLPYIPALVRAARSPFAESGLPEAIQRAVITDAGRLTPAYAYLNDHVMTGVAP